MGHAKMVRRSDPALSLPATRPDDRRPRWLDRHELASYICVRVDQIPRMLKAGQLPVPSYHFGPRCPRWDREAVDRLFGADGPGDTGFSPGYRGARTPAEVADLYERDFARRTRSLGRKHKVTLA